MAFKMKKFGGFGNSPIKKEGLDKIAKAGTKTKETLKRKNEDVVSYESPGPGWTKLRGTNIWSPPKKGKGELDGGELD